MLEQKRFEFKLLIKKSMMVNYLQNHMFFDQSKSIIAQIKLYKSVSIRTNRLIKSYDRNFEAIDKIYTQLCSIFVIKLLINICLTYETK